MSETFKLPASSMDELVKIIKAYSSSKEGNAVSLDEISQATGVPRTIVSSNNGFLVQVGLVTEGAKKTATDTGRSLGRAYTSKIQEEVVRLWKEVVSESDFLTRMISAIRIRNGMDRASFVNHIVYSSGLKETKKSRVGASAVIEILKDINILEETEGKLTIIEDVIPTEIKDGVQESGNPIGPSSTEIQANIPPSASPSIIINININCGVNEIDQLTEKLETFVDKYRM